MKPVTENCFLNISIRRRASQQSDYLDGMKAPPLYWPMIKDHAKLYKINSKNSKCSISSCWTDNENSSYIHFNYKVFLLSSHFWYIKDEGDRIKERKVGKRSESFEFWQLSRIYSLHIFISDVATALTCRGCLCLKMLITANESCFQTVSFRVLMVSISRSIWIKIFPLICIMSSTRAESKFY